LSKANQTTEGENKLLLATDKEERAIFHVAAVFCVLGLFQGMLNLAKEILTTEEVMKLLLATDNERRTVWEVLAFCGKVNSLQKIWN
jgi:hypothetical protein